MRPVSKRSPVSSTLELMNFLRMLGGGRPYGSASKFQPGTFYVTYYDFFCGPALALTLPLKFQRGTFLLRVGRIF